MEWKIKQLKADWTAWREEAERLRFKQLAFNHYLRAYMDGEVIRSTGEIVPKESS